MNKTLKIALIITGLLVVMCAGGFGLLAFFGASMTAPEGIIITIDQPDEIYAGDTFDLVITIENVLSQGRDIKDLDFYGPLLDGVSVQSVVPQEEGSLDIFNMATYTMNIPLAANSAETITFTLIATAPGIYTSDLEVSIDKMLNVATTTHTIVIYEARN